MLEAILGAVVWITANLAYSSMARNGEQGFGRLVAFCLGWPCTFVTYLNINPAKQVAEPEPDARYQTQLELEGERDLLFEIRRDRARRISRSRVGDAGPVDEEA